MFNTNSWQSHEQYRRNLHEMKVVLHLSPTLNHSYRVEREKLYYLDLDPVGDYIASFYSSTGRPAISQAQILRSLILFALLFNKTAAGTSLTKWVNEVLPNDIALVALIGCSSPLDLPPLGSYYDFMNRFWLASRDIYRRSCLLDARKNSKKPQKDIGPDGKLKEDASSVFSTRRIVDAIMAGEPAGNNPEAALQEIFYRAAVLPSISAGLISADDLTLSGDGTAVISHADPYGSRPSSCISEVASSCPYHADCPRHYSDPDADWGYDSSRKTWFFGRTLYMICCRNNLHKVDLPVTMKFTSAKRHDSINFLLALDDMGRHCTELSPRNFCLDSAHDNLPTYELLEHWDINALIDINSRSSSADGIPADISLNKSGHPVCRAGCEMCSWGNDPIKDAHKYRCPLKCGRLDQCPHENDCSSGSYGRTVYIKNHNDLRFQPRIPRASQEYKKLYAERTACERVNARVLNDYQLQYLKIRGDDHFSFWTMIIGICIHLDARYKVLLE